jgi:5-methylcytosine-specific restriction endonuclease McrA
MMKSCTKCGTTKPLTAFHKAKRNRDGRASECAVCFQSTRRKLDRKEYLKEYYQNNKVAYRKVRAKRRAAELQRTPPWASQEFEIFALGEIYECAQLRTEATGVPHEVDHIIPLQGETVSGLHVAGNLRVVTRAENRSKGNAYTTT